MMVFDDGDYDEYYDDHGDGDDDKHDDDDDVVEYVYDDDDINIEPSNENMYYDKILMLDISSRSIVKKVLVRELPVHLPLLQLLPLPFPHTHTPCPYFYFHLHLYLYHLPLLLPPSPPLLLL